jgi:hypothetical protein
VAWIFFSPYLAVLQLRRAIERGDVEAIRQGVDFPALRESMKDELRSQLAQSMSKQTQSGFEVLGGMLAATMINQIVDNFITPQAIVNASQGRQVQKTPEQISGLAQVATNQNDSVSMAYDGWNRFIVTVKSNAKDESLKLVWYRSGLVSWHLSALHMQMASI